MSDINEKNRQALRSLDKLLPQTAREILADLWKSDADISEEEIEDEFNEIRHEENMDKRRGGQG